MKYTIICKNTKEVIKGTDKLECYRRYLKTNHWRKLRLNIAYKRDYRCQMCGQVIEKGYHIHHLTYENIGNEKDSDLLLLCEKCHDEIHDGKLTRYKTGEDLLDKINKSPDFPQNYIKTNSYKSKKLENKIKYLIKCLDNSSVCNIQDKLDVVKYIEDFVIKKYTEHNEKVMRIK